jgi:Restriction endonuclease fold toxin 5
LVTDVDVLDRALADLRPGDREPDASPAPQDREPKLCPRPTPEPMTAKDRFNSIRYQEYVSKLPYGWAINVLGVNFDGCDPKTGNLLEAKADIDFLFDDDDELLYWAKKKKNKLADQMVRQADAAEAAGRIVFWHAQTLEGYRGLSTMAVELRKTHESVEDLHVIHDPN